MPQLLYRIKPNQNGKTKPTSGLYSNTYGSTAENYLGFVCLGFFSMKMELRKRKREKSSRTSITKSLMKRVLKYVYNSFLNFNFKENLIV